MLVLMRETGQEIVIDGRTVIRVCRVIGCGKVLLGVSAPPEVSVVRKELMEAAPLYVESEAEMVMAGG
jgi:carbon storage regulator CsrA